jgi:hypothetical protein
MRHYPVSTMRGQRGLTVATNTQLRSSSPAIMLIFQSIA